MAEKLTLKQGTVVFVGNLPFEFDADTSGTFPTVENPDVLAELLAANSAKVYGDHRAALAHEEVRVVDGKTVAVNVTYGVGGARNEEVVEREVAPAEPETPAVPADENPPAGGESDAVN